MGVYSIGNITTVNGFELDSMAESKHSVDVAGAYAIMAENEQNFNGIMQAIGIHELNVLETTGKEIVYEAVDVKGIFTKVKEFLQNILKKIGEMFKKFITMIDSLVASDDAFVKKYGSKIKAVKKTDIDYDGYNFTLDWSVSTADAAMKGATKKLNYDDVKDEAAVKSILDNNIDLDDIKKDMRGAAIGKDGIDSSDFATEIFKRFHDGEDSKTTVKSIDTSKIVETISSSKKAKDDAKKMYHDTKKVVKKELSDLDSLDNKLNKSIRDSKDSGKTISVSEHLSVVTKATDVTKTRLGILNTVQAGYMSALKAENRQARAIAVKLLVQKESAGFEHYTESGSFLDGVEFK